ncbi:hypothetical protein L1887_42051 [Cichorium endivia]|nr:hypothetical protein L1887_42051 [Cichorium endivia]
MTKARLLRVLVLFRVDGRRAYALDGRLCACEQSRRLAFALVFVRRRAGDVSRIRCRVVDGKDDLGPLLRLDIAAHAALSGNVGRAAIGADGSERDAVLRGWPRSEGQVGPVARRRGAGWSSCRVAIGETLFHGLPDLIGEEEVEIERSQARTCHQVDQKVMQQTHGGPAKPEGIEPVEYARVEAKAADPDGEWEEVGAKEREDGGVARVERRKRAEDDRCTSESEGVAVRVEELVDACEAGRGSAHAVVGGDEALAELVPGRSAGEEDLDDNTCEHHESESLREDLDRGWRRKDEEEGGDEEGGGKVDDAVRDPCEDVEDGVTELGENVRDVGTIPDRFERGQHRHPDVRTERGGDELARVEEDQPGKDGCRRQEELRSDGQEQRDDVERRDDELEGERGALHDVEREERDEEEESVLEAFGLAWRPGAEAVEVLAHVGGERQARCGGEDARQQIVQPRRQVESCFRWKLQQRLRRRTGSSRRQTRAAARMGLRVRAGSRRSHAGAIAAVTRGVICRERVTARCDGSVTVERQAARADDPKGRPFPRFFAVCVFCNALRSAQPRMKWWLARFDTPCSRPSWRSQPLSSRSAAALPNLGACGVSLQPHPAGHNRQEITHPPLQARTARHRCYRPSLPSLFPFISTCRHPTEPHHNGSRNCVTHGQLLTSAFGSSASIQARLSLSLDQHRRACQSRTAVPAAEAPTATLPAQVRSGTEQDLFIRPFLSDITNSHLSILSSR